MTSETLTIRSRDGLSLEATLDEPSSDARDVVVFCHPHPNFGGTMNAPLLLALRDDLTARLVEMSGANHFFWAKYDDLAEIVGAFLEDVF